MLHFPLDGCDTFQENGKNGGIVRDGCLYWILDPNWKYNYPYAGMICMIAAAPVLSFGTHC